MKEREVVAALAAEIQRATAAGDYHRAHRLVELQTSAIARIKRKTVAEASPGYVSAPLPRTMQLGRIARHISNEALSAGLAADRADGETLGEVYQRLALLFAEFRLVYAQYLGDH